MNERMENEWKTNGKRMENEWKRNGKRMENEWKRKRVWGAGTTNNNEHIKKIRFRNIK